MAVGIGAILKGLAVTMRNVWRKPVTVQYPEQIRPKPVRFHGRHILNRHEDGSEKCIGCELCAGACPARCIYVRGADNPPCDPISPGERYGYVYQINFLRCIFCGLCVEACPTGAITMSNLFELSFEARDEAIFGKDLLLVEPDGTPRHKGDFFDPRVLDEAGGWMRATSPAGAAQYEGVVAWTPDAGHGLRSAEVGQSAKPQSPADAEAMHQGDTGLAFRGFRSTLDRKSRSLNFGDEARKVGLSGTDRKDKPL